MNGAQSLIGSLVASGVTTCFGNPGTSEMHFVGASDSSPEMRPVLCLIEGVATGAADGYARMSGRPAATLLHLGPGLANGLANLHNARRAKSPVVNVVGDHPPHHSPSDAPLPPDLVRFARPVSDGCTCRGAWHRSAAARAVSCARRAEAGRDPDPPGRHGMEISGESGSCLPVLAAATASDTRSPGAKLVNQQANAFF